MALNAAIVWEIRTGGADTNGGGFKTGAVGGTDRSQQNGPFASLTTLSVVNATTTKVTVSLTDYTVVATDVGNVLNVTGGTATAGLYEITAVDTAANTWTVDRSLGTAAQTVVGAMGGALFSPGYWAGKVQSGGVGYLKNDGSVFSITSATANIASGVIGPAVDAVLIGYTSTRTTVNTDTRPTIQLNVASATMFPVNAVQHAIHIICDGNNQTSAKLTSGASFEDCALLNFKTQSSGNNSYRACSATGNSATIFVGSCEDCEAYANTAVPFSIGTSQLAHACLSYNNTGANTDGFTTTNNGAIVNCDAYGNGRDGFRLPTAYSSAMNCHAESNTGAGFNMTGTFGVLRNCSTYLNTGGPTTGTFFSSTGAITLSATAYTNAAGGDFSKNTTTGGGASLRAAAYPSAFPIGTTPTARDVGATQHADPVVLLVTQGMTGGMNG